MKTYIKDRGEEFMNSLFLLPYYSFCNSVCLLIALSRLNRLTERNEICQYDSLHLEGGYRQFFYPGKNS